MTAASRISTSLPYVARNLRQQVDALQSKADLFVRLHAADDDAGRTEEARKLIAEAEELFRRAGELLKQVEAMLPDDPASTQERE